MPRPDKEISPGRLDGPVSPARAHSWTKYGGHETIEGQRDAPSHTDAESMGVTVDDITVTEYPEESTSKYMTRGTSAHGIGAPEIEGKAKHSEIVREWVIDRLVEGRTYHRTDKLITVELES